MTGELRNARVVAFAGIALGWAVVHGLLILSVSAAEIVQDAAAYFPDTVGSRWHYRGHVATWPLQTVAKRQFVNVSTVRGSEEFKGVAVKVFHDTNAGNNGPSDSYYRRDAAGIVYYGSELGTTIEKQLVPYQLVRFPIKIPSSIHKSIRSIQRTPIVLWPLGCARCSILPRHYLPPSRSIWSRRSSRI